MKLSCLEAGALLAGSILLPGCHNNVVPTPWLTANEVNQIQREQNLCASPEKSANQCLSYLDYSDGRIEDYIECRVQKELQCVQEDIKNWMACLADFYDESCGETVKDSPSFQQFKACMQDYVRICSF